MASMASSCKSSSVMCSGIIIENVSINLFATDEQLRDVGLYYVIIFQTEIFPTTRLFSYYAIICFLMSFMSNHSVDHEKQTNLQTD